MENPLKLKRIHHVEFYVGNAKQASFYYRNAFGFSQVAYSGLETGNRQAASYLLRQGRADILLTTPLNPSSPASEHLRRHGDGVRDIALHVEDADLAFEEAVRRGATPEEQPHDLTDEHGQNSPRRRPHLRRHDSLADLLQGLLGAVSPRVCQLTRSGRGCGNSAHRPHGRQC